MVWAQWVPEEEDQVYEAISEMVDMARHKGTPVNFRDLQNLKEIKTAQGKILGNFFD